MISEIVKVPLGWEKVKFGDIAKNITNRIDNPKKSGLKDYIGLEHLDTDEIRIKRYGSPDEVEATKFLCKKGDIIFGKRRAYLRKLAITSRASCSFRSFYGFKAKRRQSTFRISSLVNVIVSVLENSYCYIRRFFVSNYQMENSVSPRILATQQE